MKRSIFDPPDVTAKAALLRSSSLMAPRFAPQRPQTAPNGSEAAGDSGGVAAPRSYHDFQQQRPSSSSVGAGASGASAGDNMSIPIPTSLVESATSGLVQTPRNAMTPKKLHPHGSESGGAPPVISVGDATPTGAAAPLSPPVSPGIRLIDPALYAATAKQQQQQQQQNVSSSATGGGASSPGSSPVVFYVSSDEDPTGVNGQRRGGGAPADPLDEDPIFRLWMRRNPDADAIDIAAAKHRRMKEIAEAQRTERVHFLRQLQGDLAHLKAVDELGQRAATKLDNLIASGSPADSQNVMLRKSQQQQQQQPSTKSSTDSPTSQQQQQQESSTAALNPSKRSVADAVRRAEIEAQRLAWLTYTGIVDDNPSQKQQSHIVGSNILKSLPPPGPAERAAEAKQRKKERQMAKSSDRKDAATSAAAPDVDDLNNLATSSSPHKTAAGASGELARRGWMDAAGAWHSSTDRHENAATSIQCAFRCFVARVRTAERRRLRARAIQKTVAAEAALERAWVTATTVKDNAQALASEVDRTIRIMDLFAQRAKAVIARRRRRKQREAEVHNEVAVYAATRMQAVVRGFLVRRRVAMIRDPSLAAAKLALVQNTAAAQIQRIARGKLARGFVDRRMCAATKIQAVYRRHLCLFRAGQARRQRRVNADAELADYAARTIQSFMRSLVVRRRRGLRVYRDQVMLMQRAGRGYFERCAAGTVFHKMVDEAAVDIQRMFRGWYARSHYVSGLVSAHKNAMEQALQQHAACIVTRAFRRAKIFADKRNELLRGVAATEIQRIVRGHAARQAYRQAQKREEDLLLRQMQENAATIIQTAWRGCAARKRYRLLREEEQQQYHGRPSSAASSRSAVSSGQQQQQQQQYDRPSSSTSSHKTFEDSEKNRAAASIIQRLYRRRIRRPKLLVFVKARALCIQRFLLTVAPRRTAHIYRLCRGLDGTDSLGIAEHREKADAVRLLTSFLRGRTGARAEHRSELAIAFRKAGQARAEEAQLQEQTAAASAVQRCVRGYLIRRYLLLITGLERSRKKREAAEEALKQAPPQGVTSYDAACALQEYFLRHADKTASTPQPATSQQQEQQKQVEGVEGEEKKTAEEVADEKKFAEEAAISAAGDVVPTSDAETAQQQQPHKTAEQEDEEEEL